MKTIILAVGFCLISVQSFAFDEPDNFAGIKFGEDVRTQIPRCGPGTERYTKKERCYGEVGGGYPRGWLYNLGEISNIVGDIFYEQIANKLEEIRFFFPANGSTEIMTILKERYGEPTSTEERPWQSQGGVKTTSMHAEWRGKNIWTTFDERGNKIDTGSVVYTTATSRQSQAQQQNERLKKAAGGL